MNEMNEEEFDESSDDWVRELDIILHGFDISKLSYKEQKIVEESSRKRWKLEAENERRNPTTSREKTKLEQLEARRFDLKIAKLEKKLAAMDKEHGIKPRKRG